MAVRVSAGFSVLVVTLGHALMAHAQTEEMQQTAQCVLSATKDTRSPLAVQLIRQACNDMVVHTSGLYERQRAYDQCLIQNLSGAQSNAAASQIQSACRTTYPLG